MSTDTVPAAMGNFCGHAWGGDETGREWVGMGMNSAGTGGRRDEFVSPSTVVMTTTMTTIQTPRTSTYGD